MNSCNISPLTKKIKSNLNSDSRLSNSLFLLFLIVCFIIVVIKIIYLIIIGSSLNLVAGTWIGLAMDLSDGIFYRPLFSDAIGFGGTRFFPLFFSIHALLIKLFSMPILTGHIVSLFSGLLLLGGCFAIFRQMKIELIIIFGLLVLLLSGFSIQLGFTTIRADILPVALNIIGIAFILSNYSTKFKIIFASVFFTLAFSAKMTAIHGILSVFIWLILTKRTKEALWVLLLTSIGYILFFGILSLGTSGRIISIFTSCSSGGADLYAVLKAPIKFFKKFLKYDTACFLLSLWILLVVRKYIKSFMTNLFFIFWLVSIIITVFIYGSPGTDYNHLVDVSTASILLVGSVIYYNKSQSAKPFIYSCLILIVFAIIYNAYSLKSLLADKNNYINNRFPEEVVNLCKHDEGIVLYENPLIPILASKKPYVLDSFMLRLLVLNNKGIKSSLLNTVNKKKYSAIVFNKDPLLNIETDAYYHFGYDFIQAVIRNYKVGMRQGNYVVYIPNLSDYESVETMEK